MVAQCVEVVFGPGVDDEASTDCVPNDDDNDADGVDDEASTDCVPNDDDDDAVIAKRIIGNVNNFGWKRRSRNVFFVMVVARCCCCRRRRRCHRTSKIYCCLPLPILYCEPCVTYF